MTGRIRTIGRWGTTVLATCAAVSAATAASAQNGATPPLARLQFDIVGIRLVVDPPALTVPRNIPTLINTSLALPPSAGSDVRDALAALTAGAVVEAELRGPAIPPTRITVVPGQPIPIPAFALPGDYFLDGIRLARNGRTILDATAADGRPATTIPIRVINEVFVTSVTSRPLTLEEIRERGLVIDSGSFQAVNFQVAFNIDGQPFTIDMPSLLPTPELLRTTSDRTTIIRQVAAMNQALAATQTTLPPQFDRPGINFSIAALPFMFVPEDGDVPSLDIPPVNGLVVIAGNVGFLHQFFKVAVLVANVAPDGSMLSLRDVTGTVTLPRGLDGVAGTTAEPGDDPLRLARIDGIGVQPVTPIVRPGPDGALETADDIPVIAPQQQGEGALLLEGLKEGGHTFDVAIEATLDGLPSGPVRMTGLAAGAVFVRNPTFSVTLAHPRTIRSGETYDLYATVTNTSRSPANLVSINLDPLSISGAQLLSDATVTFESIGAGQAATAKFTLRAQQTGEVTFSSFTGDASAGGNIRLFTGVGERNVVLAPNSIVLPAATAALPPELVAAAQRVLGQAFSIATSPPEAIPPDVRFVRRQTVIDRGLELAEAGERVQFGEPLARVLQDLLLDWLGNGGFDDGFDQLLRTTEAGAEFLAVIGSTMGPTAAAGGLEYQQSFAQSAAARERAHVSVVATAAGNLPAPSVTVTRADGTIVQRGVPGAVTMPGGAVMSLEGPSSNANMAVLALAEPLGHVVEFVAPAAGVFDLGIVIPGGQPGILRQLRYGAVALGSGGVARVDIDLSVPEVHPLQIDANGDGVIEVSAAATEQLVTSGAPLVLDVRQLESSLRDGPGNPLDPATYGLLVAVLFDRPVTTESAELRSNYTLDSNVVIGARLQPSRRLVYLYLQQPVGGLTPRSLTISGIEDLRGVTLPSATRTITSSLADGGRVFGQVREAGGLPVPGAVLKLTVVVDALHSFDVATIRVDRNGSFDFDFVPRAALHFVLTAQHPVTRDLTTLTARVRGAGEQLLLNPTFTGRGTVRGRLLAADGLTPVPGVPVALIPGAILGQRGYQDLTDALGEFVFTDMPVGVFTLAASDGRRGFVQVQGVVERAGQVVVRDLVLVTQPDEGGRLVGRAFLADGLTPGRGFSVYVGQYYRAQSSIAAVDSAVTDDSGSFTFARSLPPGSYDVVVVDPATQQVGTTSVSIVSRVTTSVNVVLEATGSVEGVVFNAQGQPVAGAVIAGGAALGTADVNGFFRIEGVPAGPRTIEAGDPVTRRRGSAPVTVVPGQVARISIALEARATITGRVLDASGNPMPRVSVRLPVVGGYSFVFTNNQGVYTFPDLQLGSHLIQAPGPSVDSLIDYLEANGYDPRSAFTTGDAPEGLGGPPPPSSGDRNAILAAYERAVQSFLSVDEAILGLPMAEAGGFGWNRVQLFQDSTTVVADVRFLSKGSVSGRTEDAAGRPTGALVRITGLAVSNAGFATIAELGRRNSDAASGSFSFVGIPRFDLATFQTAGVRGGDFTLEAAQPFSPVILAHRGQLTPATPNLADVVLRFPSATDTNGTVSGRVLLPDMTPGPANTQVRISFGDLTVVTGADGRFVSALPIPAGTYVVTATAPNGLRGQATAAVPAGGNVDIQVRLLGLGHTTVVVRRPNGLPVVNALVRLERGTFPGDRADGRTDAAGTVRFVNLSEGPVALLADEEATGLNGRASGTIVRDTDVTIPITIRASGQVTGTFLTADGTQPIAAAQVVVSAAGVQAFATTDAAGRFEVVAVPVGPFTVDASDPLTGRVGRANGELTVEGQTVDITVLQLPRGTVAGVVLNADGATPVAAARVRIIGDGTVRTDLQATARADGGFRFEGVPQGTFRIEAVDPISGFEGTAPGRIDTEGAFVDVNVTLEPFGALDVAVQDHTGAPAGNVTVTVSGPGGTRTGAVNPDGRFLFEYLRLGTYRIIARSLADPGDGGEALATIESANQQIPRPVQLRGSGSVTVTVVGADGVTPVASSRVTVNADAAFGSNPPGPIAATLNGFTDAAGQLTLVNVPIGNFSARAEAGALAGVSTGVLPAPGAVTPVTVQLGASGSVSGRVLLPDGVTPAAQAFVTLRFQSQSQLQSGVLQVTTGVDGTFAFAGIPLGSFTVAAIEVVTTGVRNTSGTLSANGQVAAVGDLVLDNSGPRVAAIVPADRSSNVAPDSTISITFDEPIQPSTISTGTSPTSNVVLLQGGTRVPLQAAVFSDGNRVVAVRPVSPLTSAAVYSLTITGGQDGPQNESGLSLPEPVVSTFTVRDLTPPAVLSISPAPEAQGVLPEAAVRVTFSEPVAGAAIVLRTSAGAVVPGTSTLAAGNTVAVFAPQDFLQPNTAYSFAVSGAIDAAGNALAGGTVESRFFTVDTISPVIAALQIAGTPRAGSTIGVQAIVPSADAVRVEFRSSHGFAAADTSAPFGVDVLLPADRSTLTLSATAVDHAGNRSAVFEQSLAVLADLAPNVSLTNLSGSTDARQGQALTFQLLADDDAALATVLFSAVGAAVMSTVQPVPQGQTTFTTTFSVPVPLGAQSGQTLTVQAASVDSLGQQSTPASITFTVRDGIRPGLTVVAPVNDAQVLPGQSVAVTFDASDDVALASVALVCNPALSGCESRSLADAPQTTRQTFMVQVPADLQAPAVVSMTARAVDTSGNLVEVGRTLRLADTIAPVVASLVNASGSNRVLAGEQVTLRAAVSDNVGVTSLVFEGAGAAAFGGTIAMNPPVTSGQVPIVFTVPPGTPDGTLISVLARARDAAGNTGADASLTLTIGDTAAPGLEALAPAEGAQVAPGQRVTMRVRATDDVGIVRVIFQATGVMTAAHEVVLPAPLTTTEAIFDLDVPAGTPAGGLTLSARAMDIAGNSSLAVTRTVSVSDVAAPSVTISSPATGAAIDPRSPLSIVVNATDQVGVAQVTYTAAGIVTATESRAVVPAATVTQQTFPLSFAPLPARGGMLTIGASARDAAGNSGSATTVTVSVLDVVAPAVIATAPGDGATGVDRAAALTVRFSEPMAPGTLTGSVQLRRDGSAVAATIGIDAANEAVTLTPVSPLASNTVYALVVTTAATDAAGNALPGEQSFSFRTASTDVDGPRIVSIVPAGGAVNVALTAPIDVTFDEPIDPATVDPVSLRVEIAGTAIDGVRSFLDGNRTVRFRASEPWPASVSIVLTLAQTISDMAGNLLADSAGVPLPAPLSSAFTTTSFGITSPSGDSVTEDSHILLEARAGNASGIATVVFTVNGQAQPAVSGPAFSRPFVVPAAATTPQLVIRASARDAQGTEVASDERTIPVVVGLRVAPTLLGVPIAGTSTLRFSISSALSADLTIQLRAGNPSIVTFPVNPVVLPAGATEVLAVVSGAAEGNTAVFGDSDRGSAAAIVSVSPLVAGRELAPLAGPVGVSLSSPPSAGLLVLAPNSAQTVRLRLLISPAETDLPVTITSTNAAVAIGSSGPVVAGQLASDLEVTTLAAGVATLIVRVGNTVLGVTVIVGTPPPGSIPMVVAPPTGTAISNPPNAGQIIASPGANATIQIVILTAPAGSEVPVSVTSSDPAVATASAIAIPAGSVTAEIAVAAISNGIVTLIVRAGTEIRSVTVYVGTPPAGLRPLLLAPPVGSSISNPPAAAQLVTLASATSATAITLLSEPAPAAAEVSVSTSDPAVATATADPIAAGSRTTVLRITTGVDGVATLILRSGSEVRSVTVFVGTPPADRRPVLVAPLVGASIATLPTAGTVVAQSGAPILSSLGVQLLTASRTTPLTVVARTGNPAIVQLGAADTVTLELSPGQLVVDLPIVTSGTEGTAIVTFEFDGERRQLLIVVGSPPASQRPALVAPVVGVRAGG